MMQMEKLMKLAQQENMDTQLELGLIYYYGEGVEVDKKQAVQWISNAAEQGSANAQYILGKCYSKGQGVAKDLEAAVKWLTLAAKQGHMEAIIDLGNCYNQGTGVKRNLSEALKYFKTAYEKGATKILVSIKMIEESLAKDNVEEDWEQKAMELKEAAERGDKDAQFELASLYHSGKGVDKNLEESMKWYQEAKKNGWAKDEAARNELELRIEYIEMDLAARQSFLESLQKAKQGNAEDLYSVGVLYNFGEGTEVDEEEAADYFRKAAKLGHAEAQYWLGVYYSRGLGVKLNIANAARLNLEEAAKWLKKAADQGFEDAELDLYNVRKKLEAMK